MIAGMQLFTADGSVIVILMLSSSEEIGLLIAATMAAVRRI